MATTTTYLGRCETRGCDHAIHADAANVVNVDAFNGIKPNGVFRVENGPRIWSRCPEHGRTFMLKAVQGTYSETVKCDSRCQNAKGHTCTCACGGLNHGRGYATTAKPVEYTPVRTYTATENPHVVAVEISLPEVGSTIRANVKVQSKTLNVGNYANTLVTFQSVVNPGVPLKWFAPANLALDYEVGEEYSIRAEVKRHNEWNGRTEAIITYVEKIEE
jgi:hypothetical protein